MGYLKKYEKQRARIVDFLRDEEDHKATSLVVQGDLYKAFSREDRLWGKGLEKLLKRMPETRRAGKFYIGENYTLRIYQLRKEYREPSPTIEDE